MEAYLDWQSKSSGIKLNDVIEEYRYVAAGKKVKAGDLVNYINGVAGKVDYGESESTQLSSNPYLDRDYKKMDAIALDNNRVFVAYSYSSSRHLYGMIVTVNGTTIELGAETQLSTSNDSGESISMLLLADGKIFIAHTYPSYNYLYAMVVTVEGETIAAGADTQLSTKKGSGSHISTVLLPNGNVFVAHSYDSDADYYLYGTVCVISGTTITKGTNTALVASAYAGVVISTCLLPNGNVFIAHSYAYNKYLYGMVVSIRNTTITAGTDTQLGSGRTGSGATAILLPNGNVFVAHNNYAMICTVSETTITAGTDIKLVDSVYENSTAILLNDNAILFVHGYDSSYCYLYGAIYNVSDTTITAGSDVQLSSINYSGYHISPVLLPNETIFIANGGATSMQAQVFAIDEANNVPTNHVTGIGYETQVKPATESPFNAIALSSGVGGTDIEHKDQVKIARPNVGVI